MSNSNAKFYTRALERFFLARRRTNTGPSLPKAILKIAHALTEWQNCPPLSYSVSLERHIELSEAGITEHLKELEDSLKSFILYSHPQNPQVTLYVHTGEFNEDQDFYFFLPRSVDLERLNVDKFMNLVAQLCEGFGATSGSVYDNYLGRLFGYEKRSYERLVSEVSPEERASIPGPYQLYGIEDTLPELLIMDEFDYHVVPNQIGWVNFWDRAMVQTVGIERVKNAPWARQLELPNGAMVFASTELPTDVYDPEHLEKLSQIAQALELRELQEAYKFR